MWSVLSRNDLVSGSLSSDSDALPFGGQRAFGHDGAGGALTFGDSEIGMAFGFTTDLVPELAGADPEALDLVQVARSCILRPLIFKKQVLKSSIRYMFKLLFAVCKQMVWKLWV